MRRLAAVAALISACGGPQIQQRSVGGADMAKAIPAALEVEKPREGDPRTVKVRVWTDPGARAQKRWKDDISEQIDYANSLLTPLLGARLQIADWKEWSRTGEPHEALAQLALADKGDGVTWVIGYIAAPDTAAKTMAELGYAEPLGRHVVIRSWNDLKESEAISGSLPDLKEAERQEVYAAHRRHKQTVVLLRALATTLGGIAETDPNWVLHPSYSRKQVGVSDRNRELMTLALDARLAEETDQVIAKKLLESIEKSAWGGWIASSQDEVTKRLRNVLDQAKAGKTAVDIPPAAYDQYSRIKTLALQKKTQDALIELENLLTAYPGNAAMHMLRCEILLGAAAASKDPKAGEQAKTACKRVSELAPGDPSPHLSIGETLLRAGDVKAARAEFLLAEGKIDNLSQGKEDAWRRLIALYQGMGALTWTEQAIARAKLTQDPVAVQIAQTRARYGVPRGSKVVVPEQEAALVAAVRAALDAVYASKYGEAEKALSAAEKKWPGAAGLAGARCDLGIRMGQIEAARAACARALATDPQASWALYLSGVLSLHNASGTKAGIEKLKKAIEVDPELGQAWRTLAKAYARAKDKAALEQLGKDYAAKFGQPLPP
jgi:predicted Zn-dependent protease